jgi:isopentenyl-diphosphate delta-isomerase
MNGRKADQLKICLSENVSADYNYWDDIKLIHNALPEINKSEIDTSTIIFGKKLSAPIIISAITGGCEEAEKINKNLAIAAEHLSIGLGVGSERAVVEDKKFEATYSIVKEYEIPLVLANIGVPQLIAQKDKLPLTYDDIKYLMSLVDAHMLAIHLNFLQEAVQPEGDSNAKGCLNALAKFANRFPVIAKETGAGINREIALKLKRTKVKGIDIGGAGGTSFAAVEHYRAKLQGNVKNAEVGKTFWNWGIPTPIAVLECKVTNLPIIATGGIRNGLDIARALAIGADTTGVARKLLKPAMESAEKVISTIELMIEELRTAMFLTGCSNIKALAKCEYIIGGETQYWLR